MKSATEPRSSAPLDAGAFLPWAKPDYWGREREYVLEALDSTWISGGPFVDRLERDFSAYTSSTHALAVANGTASIHLAYLGLGIEPGDEIVVPGFCFLAAANVALHMGARPVFAEVDPRSWCMTAEAVEAVLTPRTRAIVPVHTYGNVCDMDPILALAAARRIPVIEDAAESFACRYRGRQAGTLATIGSFSFQATKTITTGEGGMVVTEDEELKERMALYRSHGMLRTRYWHEVPGLNFRLTNLQAALGVAQLEQIDRIVSARKRVHELYRERLGTAPGLRLQHFTSDVDPVLWAIAAQLDPAAFPQGRDEVMEQMRAAGIETRPGFYAASQLDIYDPAVLPICEEVSRTVISLPTYPTLTGAEIDRICDELTRLRR